MGGFWQAAALMLALATPHPIDSTPAVDSGLRVHGGTAAWLAGEGDASEDRTLVVRHAGRTRAIPTDPDLPWTSFDLGTDARGRVVLVYATCAGSGSVDCELRRARPDGTDDRRIPATGSHPTLSRGRLVYARGGEVVERPLDAPAAQPSRRVAKLAGVEWLERAGPWLAAVTNTDEDQGGFGTRRLRLADLRRGGRTRTVGQVIVGLSDQSYVGPSFAGDHLGWYYACPGDSGGCSVRGGTWRLDLRTGAIELAPGPSTVGGFALARDGRATTTHRGRVRFLPPRPFAPLPPSISPR